MSHIRIGTLLFVESLKVIPGVYLEMIHQSMHHQPEISLKNQTKLVECLNKFIGDDCSSSYKFVVKERMLHYIFLVTKAKLKYEYQVEDFSFFEMDQLLKFQEEHTKPIQKILQKVSHTPNIHKIGMITFSP